MERPRRTLIGVGMVALGPIQTAHGTLQGEVVYTGHSVGYAAIGVASLYSEGDLGAR